MSWPQASISPCLTAGIHQSEVLCSEIVFEEYWLGMGHPSLLLIYLTNLYQQAFYETDYD